MFLKMVAIFLNWFLTVSQKNKRMKLKLSLLFTIIMLVSCKGKIPNNLETKFENSKGFETATYQETIDFYKNLAIFYPEISMKEMGKTDSGYPLHLVIFNQEREFDFDKIHQQQKTIILINNAIHPGESDGVDASMMLLRDLATKKIKNKSLKNTVLVIIPMYNIGGALNRNSFSRANQNGPVSYGFRGNAENYDLNRDFIKTDTKNAKSFQQLFHLVKPDVFVDTHVSNGADYQYGITHLFTQHNQLGNDLGAFIETEMRPKIEALLLQKNIIVTPYVNVWGTTPEVGFSQFLDYPRYSSGYTTLFNVFGLMIETHMLKPYKIRVEQTYHFLESILTFSEAKSKTIKELRKNAVQQILAKKMYPIDFEIDSLNFTELQFKGYEGTYKKSEVTTGNRLFYDRTKPYTKSVKYYNNFKPSKEIEIPKAYILKQGWYQVMDRLKNNNINFTVFKNDTTLLVAEQHIKSYQTVSEAYEGHYMHYNTEVASNINTVIFKRGDIFIPTNQSGIRYILETLETEASDSFFNWNFFDTILQQKEHYSPYVFEDIAAKLLRENVLIKNAFDKKMREDKEFAQDSKAQLDFVYKHSPYYEDAHLKLPVYKLY